MHNKFESLKCILFVVSLQFVIWLSKIHIYFNIFLPNLYIVHYLCQTKDGSFVVSDSQWEFLVLTRCPSKGTATAVSNWNNKTSKASPGVYRYYQILQDITKHIRLYVRWLVLIKPPLWKTVAENGGPSPPAKHRLETWGRTIEYHDLFHHHTWTAAFCRHITLIYINENQCIISCNIFKMIRPFMTQHCKASPVESFVHPLRNYCSIKEEKPREWNLENVLPVTCNYKILRMARHFWKGIKIYSQFFFVQFCIFKRKRLISQYWGILSNSDWNIKQILICDISEVSLLKFRRLRK